MDGPNCPNGAIFHFKGWGVAKPLSVFTKNPLYLIA